jgi:type IV secretory pathway VirB2 component (pilin)
VEGVAAMVDHRGMICRFLAVLAIIAVGGCSASGPKASFETAYSAIGAQVK